MVFKKRKNIPDILNMPNTRNLLSSDFLVSLIWFNIDPISDYPNHMCASFKVFLRFEGKEKTFHFVDYSHSIDILFSNIMIMLETSLNAKDEYNDMYMKGVKNLKHWFLENKNNPKKEMSSLGFNRLSNM